MTREEFDRRYLMPLFGDGEMADDLELASNGNRSVFEYIESEVALPDEAYELSFDAIKNRSLNDEVLKLIIEALCKDDPNNVFDKLPRYKTKKIRESIVAAKAVCKVCTVRSECLSTALETHQVDGVWGGLTPVERAHLR